MVHPHSDGGPTLVVLEQGRLRTVPLAGQEKWTVGRRTETNCPDIPLASKIAGRKHGEFFCIDGLWFYCDRGSLNGTFRGDRKLKPGLGGRAAPVMLQEQEVLRIDCGDSGSPDERGVFMLFLADGTRGSWEFCPLDGRTAFDFKPAALARWNESWILSGGGVRLNGKPLEAPAALKERDWLSIGHRHAIFTGKGLFRNIP